jgi:hypothetical protein
VTLEEIDLSMSEVGLAKSSFFVTVRDFLAGTEGHPVGERSPVCDGLQEMT